MSSIPQDLLYSADHEYVKKTADPSVVLVGITDYAQGELGDIVYLEMPAKGRKLASNEVFGTIEAVKAVSELFSPLAGEVLEINPKLDAEPALVNTDPYGDGWMVRLKVAPDALTGLMDAAAYGKHVGQ
ncbi:MAG: glycine cleavage system protein GcvH [Gemmatimonadaceae bacterium]